MKSIKKERKDEDLKILLSPHEWAYWPLLPVVRRNYETHDVECGIVISGSPHVYLANIFQLPEDGIETTADIKKKYRVIEYESYKQLLDDGWEVD